MGNVFCFGGDNSVFGVILSKTEPALSSKHFAAVHDEIDIGTGKLICEGVVSVSDCPTCTETNNSRRRPAAAMIKAERLREVAKWSPN
jgi:hypothetical protein